MQLDVLESGVTPAVGSPAFPSRNLTAREVPELTQLTSDGTPDPDPMTLKPRSASSSAIARPMPRLAPVTRATC